MLSQILVGADVGLPANVISQHGGTSNKTSCQISSMAGSAPSSSGFWRVYDGGFRIRSIVDSNPKLDLLLEVDEYPFAHGAGPPYTTLAILTIFLGRQFNSERRDRPHGREHLVYGPMLWI